MMDELGAGFFLAMHDLEIRGAGEVLGESQSGEMQEIGFNLYADMLKHAVRSLKAGSEPDLSAPRSITTEINLHLPALLPSDYCSDVHERLTLYKRLANCETAAELDAMQEELIDRFGLAPEPAQALLESHRLRIAARALWAWRASTPAAMRSALHFIAQPPLDGARFMQMLAAAAPLETVRPEQAAGANAQRRPGAAGADGERLAENPARRVAACGRGKRLCDGWAAHEPDRPGRRAGRCRTAATAAVDRRSERRATRPRGLPAAWRAGRSRA